jgi:hypothetical protein
VRLCVIYGSTAVFEMYCESRLGLRMLCLDLKYCIISIIKCKMKKSLKETKRGREPRIGNAWDNAVLCGKASNFVTASGMRNSAKCTRDALSILDVLFKCICRRRLLLHEYKVTQNTAHMSSNLALDTATFQETHGVTASGEKEPSAQFPTYSGTINTCSTPKQTLWNQGCTKHILPIDFYQTQQQKKTLQAKWLVSLSSSSSRACCACIPDKCGLTCVSSLASVAL